MRGLPHYFCSVDNFPCKLLLFMLLICGLLQIFDLVPILANLYFEGRIPVTLSYAQASVLLCIGLQGQNISYIEVCFST